MPTLAEHFSMHLVLDFDDTRVRDTTQDAADIVLAAPGRPEHYVAIRPHLSALVESAAHFDRVLLCSWSPSAYLEAFRATRYGTWISDIVGREALEERKIVQFDADFVIVDDMPAQHELLLRKFALLGIAIDDPSFAPGTDLEDWRAARRRAFQPIQDRLVTVLPFECGTDRELLRVAEELVVRARR